MSSGDIQSPPTYYFSGITFNPSFYATSTGDYLTSSTARKYFLSYPIAQGTETISTLNCAILNAPSSTSNLDLGINIINGTISMGDVQTNGSIIIGNNNNTDTQIKGGTIKLMNNTNSYGRLRSVYYDSLTFDGFMAIAENQTTGVLEIANTSLRNADVDIAKNAIGGTVSLGSNSNDQTDIRGGIIQLLNDTTVYGTLNCIGILSATIGTLSGKTSYETTAVAYTIPSTTINQNYYLFCTGTTTYQVILPSVFNTSQVVHIRNGCTVALTLTTNELGTKIYPTGVATVFTTNYPSFGVNTAQRLYSNGTNWIGF
jgi:predicted acyltransferase (DUF342 family)